MSFTSPFADVEIPDVSVYDFLFGDIAEGDLERIALVDPKSDTKTTYRALPNSECIEVFCELS